MSTTPTRLTDARAAELAVRLYDYFADAVETDPQTPHPGNLTVRELIEDLEMSVPVTDPAFKAIEGAHDAILDLFMS